MSLRTQDERKLRFRFAGRFVFAQPTNDKSPELKVLAIDPTFCQDVPSECHRVAMTAPWSCINPLGSCLPDLRLYSSSAGGPDGDGSGRLEQAVWFLDGCQIRIEPVPGSSADFAWEKKDHLLRFDQLVQRGSAAVDKRFTETAGGPASAIIHVNTGAGREADPAPERFALAELHVANQAASGADPVVEASDLIDVVLKIGPEPYVITLISKDSRRRCIAFLTQPAVETVVSISNLCARSSFEDFDAEFASMYEVLAQPPATRMRRVPRTIPHLNGRIDCHSPVYGLY